LPTSTGESPYYLEIEKGYNKYMEEYHSTPSSHTLLHMAAAPLSLFFSSLHVLTHSHVLSPIFLSNIVLLYRHFMVNMEGPITLKHGMNCGTIHAATCLVVGYCHKWQYPNNHPLCHLCGQLSSCFFSTSLHPAAFPSLPFWERLQSNIPLRAYQSCSVRNDFSSLTPRLTTPPQTNISKCDSHWVFQCDQKLTTLSRVYSSRSCACPLFHPRNHALLLRESLALSRKSPGSSPPLTMGAAH